MVVEKQRVISVSQAYSKNINAGDNPYLNAHNPSQPSSSPPCRSCGLGCSSPCSTLNGSLYRDPRTRLLDTPRHIIKHSGRRPRHSQKPGASSWDCILQPELHGRGAIHDVTPSGDGDSAALSREPGIRVNGNGIFDAGIVDDADISRGGGAG